MRAHYWTCLRCGEPIPVKLSGICQRCFPGKRIPTEADFKDWLNRRKDFLK